METVATFDTTHDDVQAHKRFLAASFIQGPEHRSFRILLIAGGVSIAYLVVAMVFIVKPVTKLALVFGGLVAILVAATLVDLRNISKGNLLGASAHINEAVQQEELQQVERLAFGPTRIAVGEEGLTFETRHLTSHTKWSGILKLDETATHLFLGSFIVPKRCFASDQDLSAFRAVIQAGINGSR